MGRARGSRQIGPDTPGTGAQGGFPVESGFRVSGPGLLFAPPPVWFAFAEAIGIANLSPTPPVSPNTLAATRDTTKTP